MSSMKYGTICQISRRHDSNHHLEPPPLDKRSLALFLFNFQLIRFRGLSARGFYFSVKWAQGIP